MKRRHFLFSLFSGLLGFSSRLFPQATSKISAVFSPYKIPLRLKDQFGGAVTGDVFIQFPFNTAKVVNGNVELRL